jgi:hypothetical protein
MKSFLFCLGTVCIAQSVLAQSVPVPRVGGSCPTGTRSSSGSCVPVGDTQVYLSPDGTCPLGWTRSARYYCVR